MATLPEHMLKFLQQIVDGGGVVVTAAIRKRDGKEVDVLCTIERGQDGKPMFYVPYAELIQDTSEYQPVDGEVMNLGALSNVQGRA